MPKKKYYAVACGRKVGVFTVWYGSTGAEAQVAGYPGARFKGFASRDQAEAWLLQGGKHGTDARRKKKKTPPADTPPEGEGEQGGIQIYTDGGCIDNPGPGGYGVVIIDGDNQVELSQGFKLTTNNRMELLACIAALEYIRERSDITLFSDSKYVVDGVRRGWAKGWRSRGWMKSNGQKALNTDLWSRLLDLLDYHTVSFRWVKGHAGNPGNERCDALASIASAGGDRLVDQGYAAAQEG